MDSAPNAATLDLISTLLLHLMGWNWLVGEHDPQAAHPAANSTHALFLLIPAHQFPRIFFFPVGTSATTGTSTCTGISIGIAICTSICTGTGTDISIGIAICTSICTGAGISIGIDNGIGTGTIILLWNPSKQTHSFVSKQSVLILTPNKMVKTMQSFTETWQLRS